MNRIWRSFFFNGFAFAGVFLFGFFFFLFGVVAFRGVAFRGVAFRGITRVATGGSSTHNNKVERRIGLLETDILTYMPWAAAPRVWWGHCARYSVTTRNLTPLPTNPAFKSPCEIAYDRQPDRSFQQPFGCLALVNIPRIERRGKLNYRRTARTCAMLDYQLRPDGHPNAYRLFDCDTGEIIIRPKEMITFNPDVPAMHHCARNISDLPDSKFVGDVIAKYFSKTLHYGRVVSVRYDSDGELLWKVVYEDGDSFRRIQHQ